MDLKIRFKKQTLLQYLMIYLMILSSRASLYAQYKEIVVYVMLGICLLVSLFVPRTRDFKLYLLFAFLAGSLMFTRFINDGGFGIDFLFINVSTIWVTYIAYTLDKENFSDRFVKTIVFFAAVGLVMWLLCFVAPDFVYGILIGETEFFGGTKGMILYTFRYASWATGEPRNVGIFTEPGIYQIVLNAAIFSYSLCAISCISVGGKFTYP